MRRNFFFGNAGGLPSRNIVRRSLFTTGYSLLASLKLTHSESTLGLTKQVARPLAQPEHNTN